MHASSIYHEKEIQRIVRRLSCVVWSFFEIFFYNSSDLAPFSSSTLSNLTTYSSIIPVSRRHHHWRHDDTKERVSMCDDFPPNFPPPDTNTTSIFCVDSRGCCNFSTVQAAVNAVANFSQKRNILWINSGIYL